MKTLGGLIGAIVGVFGTSFVGSRWGSAGQAVFLASFVGLATIGAIVVNVVKLRRSATNSQTE